MIYVFNGRNIYVYYYYNWQRSEGNAVWKNNVPKRNTKINLWPVKVLNCWKKSLFLRSLVGAPRMGSRDEPTDRVMQCWTHWFRCASVATYLLKKKKKGGKSKQDIVMCKLSHARACMCVPACTRACIWIRNTGFTSYDFLRTQYLHKTTWS